MVAMMIVVGILMGAMALCVIRIMIERTTDVRF